MICDYYIHKTALADLSSLKKKNWKFLRQISKYLLPLESWNLQLEQTKFPVFSLTGIFWWPFSLFSLCSGYPVRSLGYHSFMLKLSSDGKAITERTDIAVSAKPQRVYFNRKIKSFMNVRIPKLCLRIHYGY